MQNHYTIYMHVINDKKVTRLMIKRMVFQKFPIVFFQLPEDFNIIKFNNSRVVLFLPTILICDFCTDFNIAS